MSDVLESKSMPVLSTLAVVRDERQFVLSGVPNSPETTALILYPLVEAGIGVDAMALHAQDDGRASFSFIVHKDDYQPALAILEQLVPRWGDAHIQTNQAIARLSMSGPALWLQPGIMDVVLTALAVPNIRVDSVTTSEQTISVLIAEVDVESAVQALQQAFIGLELVTDEMRC